jgi:hypothetical protein
MVMTLTLDQDLGIIYVTAMQHLAPNCVLRTSEVQVKSNVATKK